MTTVAEVVLREAMVPGCAECRTRHNDLLIEAGEFAGAAHHRAKATASGAIERFDVLLASARKQRDYSRRALADHLRTEHGISLDVAP